MANTKSQVKKVQKTARRIKSKRRGKKRVEEENLHFRISHSNFTQSKKAKKEGTGTRKRHHYRNKRKLRITFVFSSESINDGVVMEGAQ